MLNDDSTEGDIKRKVLLVHNVFLFDFCFFWDLSVVVETDSTTTAKGSENRGRGPVVIDVLAR